MAKSVLLYLVDRVMSDTIPCPVFSASAAPAIRGFGAPASHRKTTGIWCRFAGDGRRA